MTDAPSLPGTPPSPAGGPVGDPYTPKFVDHSTLSPMARHEFQQVMRAGTLEAMQAFEAKYGAQSGSGELAAPGSPPPGEPGADTSEMEPPEVPERQALADALEGAGSNIAEVDVLEEPIDAFHARLAEMSDEQMVEAISAGHQEVEQRLFRGNSAAYEQAVRDIGIAARQVGGDALVRQISESAVLADPALFQRLWLTAKSILSGAKP